MVVRTGSVSGMVPAPAAAAFEVVTDPGRLAEWNEVVRRVVELPEAQGVGAEWVVALRPPGLPEWLSRSRTLEHDPSGGRFAYRSWSEDGNPSWATWTWQVDERAEGSRVTVSWEIHPQTFARRVFFSRLRNRALRREVRASIDALGALAAR